jgi:hypothetical protein
MRWLATALVAQTADHQRRAVRDAGQHVCGIAPARLLEQGFEVTVVRDATAGPRHPTRGDGYQAALVNYAFLAHAVAYTDDIIAAMKTPSH